MKRLLLTAFVLGACALSVSAQDGKQKKVTPEASSRSVATGKATTPTQQAPVVISVEEQNRALKEGRPSGAAADVDPKAVKASVPKATTAASVQTKKAKSSNPSF